MPLNTAKQSLASFPRSGPIILFLVVAAITAFSVFIIERSERFKSSSRLDHQATEIAAEIERSVAAKSAYLQAGATMFAAIGQVDHPLFERYAQALRRQPSYAGSRNFGWSAHFDAAFAPAFERAMRAEYGPNFHMWPESHARGLVNAIAYLSPVRPDFARYIGFDLASQPVVRAALEQAETTGQPAATDIVTRINGKPAPPSNFLIIAPAYGEVAGKRGKLRGFFFSDFHAKDFIDTAFANHVPQNETIRIYDSAVAPGNLIAEFRPGNRQGFAVDRPINVAGRTWILRIETEEPAFLSTRSLVALLTGLGFAILLLLLARSIQKGAEADRLALVREVEQASVRAHLMRELNHRVKNTLANVLSIIFLTKRRATDINTFADTLSGRVRALSATYDVLMHSEWGETLLAEVVAAEVAPYTGSQDGQIELAGPDIRLAPSDALSFGLAIHELVTNAAKYGALSVPEGRVRIDWNLATPSRAELRWEESNGPPVTNPKHRGFGSELIERIVANELKSEVELVFAPTGVRCMLTIPVRPAAGAKALMRQVREADARFQRTGLG